MRLIVVAADRSCVSLETTKSCHLTQKIIYHVSAGSSSYSHEQRRQAVHLRAGGVAVAGLDILPSLEADCDSELSILFTFRNPCKIIFQYLGSVNPERYQPLLKHYDEVFLVLNGLVQNHYLRKNGKVCRIFFATLTFEITFKPVYVYFIVTKLSFRRFAVRVVLRSNPLQLVVASLQPEGSHYLDAALGDRSVHHEKAGKQNDETQGEAARRGDNR